MTATIIAFPNRVKPIERTEKTDSNHGLHCQCLKCVERREFINWLWEKALK